MANFNFKKICAFLALLYLTYRTHKNFLRQCVKISYMCRNPGQQCYQNEQTKLWAIQLSIPVRGRILFFSLKRPDILCVPPELLFKGQREVFPCRYISQDVIFTTNCYLLPRLRMCGTVPFLPFCALTTGTGKTLQHLLNMDLRATDVCVNIFHAF